MSPREHWTLRLFALLVIGLCTIKCSPKEITTINVPARPPAQSLFHRPTAEQLAELEVQKHPRPICPPDTMGFYQEFP